MAYTSNRPTNPYSTDEDSSSGVDPISLYWTPFEQQWKDLGFADSEELFESYGNLFFDYSATEENLMKESTGVKAAHLNTKLSAFVRSEDDRLKRNKEYRQNMSVMGINSLEDSLGTAKKNLELKKSALTLGALKSLNDITELSGKTGIITGEAPIDYAYDAIKSKINMANSSHAFTRKATQKSIDDIKRENGYYSQGGEWIQGNAGNLEQIKSDAAYNMELTSKNNQLETLSFDLTRGIENLHEDWEASIIRNASKLFRSGAEGPHAEALDEWAVNQYGDDFSQDEILEYSKFSTDSGLNLNNIMMQATTQTEELEGFMENYYAGDYDGSDILSEWDVLFGGGDTVREARPAGYRTGPDSGYRPGP